MRKSTHTREYRLFLRLLIDERMRAGLTQAELGERLTFGQPGISKIERGERRVDLIELQMICEQLGIELENFVAEFKDRIRNEPE